MKSILVTQENLKVNLLKGCRQQPIDQLYWNCITDSIRLQIKQNVLNLKANCTKSKHIKPSLVQVLHIIAIIIINDSSTQFTWFSNIDRFGLWELESSYPSLSFHFWTSLEMESSSATIGDDDIARFAGVNECIGQIYRATTCVGDFRLITIATKIEVNLEHAVLHTVSASEQMS